MRPEATVATMRGEATTSPPHPVERRLELRAFSVTYPLFTLEPMSLVLHGGEAVALVGPNGSGKTTTLKAIAGRLAADYRGGIYLDGVEVRSALPAIRTSIGLVPEDLLGYRWLTVRQHLDFLRRFFPTWDRDYERSLLARLGLRDEVKLGALSKGMRVKLSFVAAEAYRPPLLLLDEPTSGLDPVVRREVIEIIRECAPPGGDRIVLFSTHLLEDVEWLAERVVVLKQGVLCADTTLEALRAREGSVAGALYGLLEGR
ncbi:MAG TPA: ABC transporter ATP-binding protein [Longimicrobiales bacterium]